jgi:hypothetical protein
MTDGVDSTQATEKENTPIQTTQETEIENTPTQTTQETEIENTPTQTTQETEIENTPTQTTHGFDFARIKKDLENNPPQITHGLSQNKYLDALPKNIYYIDNKIGINQLPRRNYDIDIRGNVFASQLSVRQGIFDSQKIIGGNLNDYQTPDGEMKITNQGIMFGGPNKDREINSAQISAGTHVPNSLNIVGMSSDTSANTRRIDMWAEGGLNLYGSQKIKGGNSNDYINPDGEMKITNQGIMFGGPNKDREINSAQISAGTHINNSLNIVGMSSDKSTNTRRIDMWAEGGLNLYGSQKITGGNINDYNNPDGQMKITNQGIMFGGPNKDREINSAQISAGTHINNSLNIVGMSSDTSANTRRIDMWAEGGLNLYGSQKITGGNINDYKTPNGQMKITNQGIMFGGPNKDREINSAQISAGTHVPNSLNIVGMSSDKSVNTRRIDMWAEGGLNLYGSQHIKGKLTLVGPQYIQGTLTLDGRVVNVQGINNRFVNDRDNVSTPIALSVYGSQIINGPNGSNPLLITNKCINNVCLQKEGVLLIKLNNGVRGFNKTLYIGEIANDMNIVQIGTKEIKLYGSLYFNISLKEPIMLANINLNYLKDEYFQKFTITTNGYGKVAFEYQNNDYSSSTIPDTDTNRKNNSIDDIQWSLKPPFSHEIKIPIIHEFKIPNWSYDSIHSIVKCKISYYHGDSHNKINTAEFKITGLKTAINSLGKLV